MNKTTFLEIKLTQSLQSLLSFNGIASKYLVIFSHAVHVFGYACCTSFIAFPSPFTFNEYDMNACICLIFVFAVNHFFFINDH